MIEEHAILAPSSAPIWGNCSGHIKASQGYPNLETEDTRRGNAVHLVGSEVLNNYKSTVDGLPLLPFQYVGKTAPNGVVIDEEMAEAADIYIHDVLAVVQEHGALQDLMVEYRVYMPQIHLTKNWGTLDAALVLPSKNLIYIWDYKNGHRENRAFGNLQLINYLGGLMHKFGIDGHSDQNIRVIARIVQPFCYKAQGPVDEWDFMLSDLRPYFNQLKQKADESFNNPTLSTGLWCRDCPAVKDCSAARRANYNFIDYVNQPYEMDRMSGADLATERAILENGLAVAKERLNAINDELFARVSGGATDTGLAVQTSSGRLEWTIPPEQAIALAGQFQADIGKTAVKTPTQAKTMVPTHLRAQFEQVLKSVSKRPAGGLTLVDAENSITARAFKPRS